MIASGEAAQCLFYLSIRTLADDRSARCGSGALLIQRDGCSDERLTAATAAVAGVHGVIAGNAAAASSDDAAAANTRVLRC